jgi:hypothetical protein
MLKLRYVILLFVLGLVLLTCGCIQKTFTDQRIIDAVQAFLDTPPDPTKQDLLTAEERAAVEKFLVYKNNIKIKYVDNTPSTILESSGKKILMKFALANREASLLQPQYVAQLYMMAMVQDKNKLCSVGEITLQNASDRMYPDLHSPVAAPATTRF